MATKKDTTSDVKGLVVRSIEDRRIRAGYTFTSTPSYVDVQADGLDDEAVALITEDPYLMAVEVDKAPKDVAPAQRLDHNGRPWVRGAYAIGNATLETATAEMVEEAKEGTLTMTHPSAPGGEPRTGAMHPEAVEANVERLSQTQLPEGMVRRRGRPPGRTAKTAVGRTGDRQATRSEKSPANEG